MSTHQTEVVDVNEDGEGAALIHGLPADEDEFAVDVSVLLDYIINLEITLNSKELELTRLRLCLHTQHARAQLLYRNFRELEEKLRIYEDAGRA